MMPNGLPAPKKRSGDSGYSSPNILRMFVIICVIGFSAAGPFPQISIGGLLPKIV